MNCVDRLGKVVKVITYLKRTLLSATFPSSAVSSVRIGKIYIEIIREPTLREALPRISPDGDTYT
jgi:hypothetical protein